jgi:hypothetical protein
MGLIQHLVPLALLCVTVTAAPLDGASLSPRDTSNQTTCSGPGIILTNKSTKQQAFSFYNNLWNGDGTAGANFDHVDQSVTLAAGAQQYVK